MEQSKEVTLSEYFLKEYNWVDGENNSICHALIAQGYWDPIVSGSVIQAMVQIGLGYRTIAFQISEKLESKIEDLEEGIYTGPFKIYFDPHSYHIGIGKVSLLEERE